MYANARVFVVLEFVFRVCFWCLCVCLCFVFLWLFLCVDVVWKLLECFLGCVWKLWIVWIKLILWVWGCMCGCAIFKKSFWVLLLDLIMLCIICWWCCVWLMLCKVDGEWELLWLNKCWRSLGRWWRRCGTRFESSRARGVIVCLRWCLVCMMLVRYLLDGIYLMRCLFVMLLWDLRCMFVWCKRCSIYWRTSLTASFTCVWMWCWVFDWRIVWWCCDGWSGLGWFWCVWRVWFLKWWVTWIIFSFESWVKSYAKGRRIN